MQYCLFFFQYFLSLLCLCFQQDFLVNARDLKLPTVYFLHVGRARPEVSREIDIRFVQSALCCNKFQEI